MNEQLVLDLAQGAVMTCIFIVGPSLGVAIIVGVLVAVFQAITSIQDMTLTFVPKIVAVGAVIIVMGSWMIRKLLGFTVDIFVNLDKFV